MDQSVILLLIGVLTLLLILTVVLLIIYSGGLLEDVKVEVGQTPLADVSVFYKFGNGSYTDILGCSFTFTEATSIAPECKCFGVYYDDPDKVQPEKLRWAVGVILKCCDTKDDQASQDQTVEKLKTEGYKEFRFPRVDTVVKSSYPCHSKLAVLIGVKRVYPNLKQYIKVKKLCAHPWLEVYDGERVDFFAPLSKQEGFYVPEALVKPKTEESEKLNKRSPKRKHQQNYAHALENQTVLGTEADDHQMLQIRPSGDTPEVKHSDHSGLRARKVNAKIQEQTATAEARSKSAHVTLCDIKHKINQPLPGTTVRSASVQVTSPSAVMKTKKKGLGDSSNSTPVADFSGLESLSSPSTSLLDDSSTSSVDSTANTTMSTDYCSSEISSNVSEVSSYASSMTSQNTTRCYSDADDIFSGDSEAEIEEGCKKKEVCEKKMSEDSKCSPQKAEK